VVDLRYICCSGVAGIKDVFFPTASQPDVVRSYQKDAYYNRLLSERFFESVSRFVWFCYRDPDEIFIHLHLHSNYQAMDEDVV